MGEKFELSTIVKRCTIEQPTYEIGRTTTELLLQRIADPGRSTRQVILKGRLLVRGSSAPQQRVA